MNCPPPIEHLIPTPEKQALQEKHTCRVCFLRVFRGNGAASGSHSRHAAHIWGKIRAMKRNPILRWSACLLLLAFFLPASVRAQSGLNARLSPPDTRAFPEIQTYLTLRAPAGVRLPALSPQSITLLEDEQVIPRFTLNEIHPGLQLAIAINPAPEFGIRDSQGVMRYEFLRQALEHWGATISAPDDVSLLIADGREITHVQEAAAWQEALRLPDPREARPNFEVLGRALDIAADPSLLEGAGRAVLFVTPLPQPAIVDSLQSVVARALQQDIAIFFWVVTSSRNFDLPQSARLRSLAAQTGGTAFFFSGTETIPSLADWLAPLRTAYEIRYTSLLRSGEEHTLKAVLSLGEESITVETPPFRYLILPPNPIFRRPPLEITRQALVSVTAAAQNLTPAVQPIEIVVEFPDGHPRDLQAARLYVDGALAAENTAPPYTTFEWNLQPYTQPGEHRLQAEVVDTLGLAGRSTETMVSVRISVPTPTVEEVIRQRLPLALGVLGSLALLLVFWYLLVSGRIQPRRVGVPSPRKVQERFRSIHALPASPWTERILRRAARSGTTYLGQLIPLGEDKRHAIPVRLVSDDLILGSDRAQALIVIKDASVAPAHARLRYQPEEGFRLTDLGSAAGTWHNYTPVPPEGKLLQDGDIIHIGRQAYRLQLPRPARRSIRIEPTRLGKSP